MLFYNSWHIVVGGFSIQILERFVLHLMNICSLLFDNNYKRTIPKNQTNYLCKLFTKWSLNFDMAINTVPAVESYTVSRKKLVYKHIIVWFELNKHSYVYYLLLFDQCSDLWPRILRGIPDSPVIRIISKLLEVFTFIQRQWNLTKPQKSNKTKYFLRSWAHWLYSY